MKEIKKFLTTAELIMQRHSGWSGVKCDFCKKETTKAQFLYSMRVFEKPLCRSCQSLESYRKKKGVEVMQIIESWEDDKSQIYATGHFHRIYVGAMVLCHYASI